jgi:signal transduction histidine kinase
VAVELRRFAVTRGGLAIEFTGAAASCLTVGIAVELQQAILNMIMNAEHALSGTSGQISVDAATTGDWATVRVRDNRAQPPIDPDGLFDLPGKEGPSDMSGLHLFAARAIAQAHGGVLGVEANGAETSFIVRVPAVIAR